MDPSGSINRTLNDTQFHSTLRGIQHIITQVRHTLGNMHTCQICEKIFKRKDNFLQHLQIHGRKKFKCSQCCKCYSRNSKLKAHQLRYHRDEQQTALRHLRCEYCLKDFARAYTLERHGKVCPRKSVEPDKPDMKTMMFHMITAEREYRQTLEEGKCVSILLNMNKDLSEESLTYVYKKALKLYRQTQMQHMSVYENAVLKPRQKEVMKLIEQPTPREVIWVVGQTGGEGKTFLQNYIKYYYSDRRVITTDIATHTKNLAHFLTKFPLECKDIFLFNHPCSTTETIAYDMLEGIKDGYKISAKYDTQGLVFKTPNTVIVFSNIYPNTEALKKDRWRIYEIKGEDLNDKTALAIKPRFKYDTEFRYHKNYAMYGDCS